MDQSGIRVIEKSALYETEPVGLACDVWFYNQVVKTETELRPEKLLRWIKNAEQSMGRIDRGHVSPRNIDIDILLAGDAVVQSEKLQIPHPRLEKRKFVLVPLAEIAPETMHPVLHKKIGDLLHAIGDEHTVRTAERQ